MRLRQWIGNLTVEKIGLFVATFLLLVTWWQACMTQQALKETQNEFASSQRPYVSLGRKDGTLAEFVEPKDPHSGEQVGIKLYLQNGGQSPALTPNVSITMSILINGTKTQVVGPKSSFQHLLRYRDANGSMYLPAAPGSIPPQSEYVRLMPGIMSEEQLESILQGRGLMLLSGFLEYCDEFGQYSCRMFDLYFQGPPINSFSEGDETDCAEMFGILYPPRRPDQTYLLPCEQPAERAAREQRERKEIAKRAISAPIATPTPLPPPPPTARPTSTS